VGEQTGQTKKYARDQWAILRNKIVGDIRSDGANKAGTPRKAAAEKVTAVEKGTASAKKRKADSKSIAAILKAPMSLTR
jgi:hypothetical protein